MRHPSPNVAMRRLLLGGPWPGPGQRCVPALVQGQAESTVVGPVPVAGIHWPMAYGLIDRVPSPAFTLVPRLYFLQSPISRSGINLLSSVHLSILFHLFVQLSIPLPSPCDRLRVVRSNFLILRSPNPFPFHRGTPCLGGGSNTPHPTCTSSPTNTLNHHAAPLPRRLAYPRLPLPVCAHPNPPGEKGVRLVASPLGILLRRGEPHREHQGTTQLPKPAAMRYVASDNADSSHTSPGAGCRTGTSPCSHRARNTELLLLPRLPLRNPRLHRRRRLALQRLLHRSKLPGPPLHAPQHRPAISRPALPRHAPHARQHRPLWPPLLLHEHHPRL